MPDGHHIPPQLHKDILFFFLCLFVCFALFVYCFDTLRALLLFEKQNSMEVSSRISAVRFFWLPMGFSLHRLALILVNFLIFTPLAVLTLQDGPNLLEAVSSRVA